MATLTKTARETIKNYEVTIAAYIRYSYPDGKWGGDKCGCPDDRCSGGFHHDGVDDCRCLESMLMLHAAEIRADMPASGIGFKTAR